MKNILLFAASVVVGYAGMAVVTEAKPKTNEPVEVNVDYYHGLRIATLVLSTGQVCVLSQDQAGSFFATQSISCK